MQIPGEETAQRKLTAKRTGEVLIEMGVLTQEQLDEAISEQRISHLRIGDIALAKGWLTKDDLMEALGRRLGVKYLDLTTIRIDAIAADLISQKDARRYSAVPVAFVDEHTVLVAMADPANIVAIDDLRILTGYDVEPAIAAGEDILEAISKMNRLDEHITEHPEERTSVGTEDVSAEDVRDIREQVDAAPVVKLVNGVLARAADEGASDIHFEPQAKQIVVLFRHDGVLQ